MAKSITNPLKRAIYNVEAKRLYHFEKRYYREMSVKLFTFVSIEDKAFFEKKFGKFNTLLVPVGTEMHEYKAYKDSSNIISFFGKMSYLPNVEAALWFSKQVFPLIQKKIPESKFYIIGKDPSKELVELSGSNPNIVVTGTVDSIEDYYEHTDIVVIPLTHGGGCLLYTSPSPRD